MGHLYSVGLTSVLVAEDTVYCPSIGLLVVKQDGGGELIKCLLTTV